MSSTQTADVTTPIAPPIALPPPRRRRPVAGYAKQTLFLLLLTGLSIIFIYPFLWAVSASLKPRESVFDDRLIPSNWQPENYKTVWESAQLSTWLLNSLQVGFLAAAAVTISSAIVAFGFAYFRFPGRNVLFGLVLATMMLPFAVTMIPVFLIWNELGQATGEGGAFAFLPNIGVNTKFPLWAMNLFGSAFYIFLLRQFFLGIPRELFEAARIDGDNFFTMFWRIAVPLAKPALVVAFVFELQASWNDLLKPLMYLQNPDLYTIPLGLKTVLDGFGQSGEMQWEIVIAATVITTIPMILIFFLGQRYFVEGIATTGRKG